MRNLLPLLFLAAAGYLLAGEKPERDKLRHVTFLHIAETHAQLETHYEFLPNETPVYQKMGGYARLKTAIDRERAAAPGACFLADGGDTFQGSGPAAWSEGEVVLEPLNALGLDIFVPGNWEVVYGPERFKALMSRIKGKVLAYNFHDKKTGERLFAPSVTLEKDGVRRHLSGHTHERTLKPIMEGNVIIVEPGSMGSFLGRLDITLAPGGGIANSSFRLISVKATDYPEDPAVKALVDTAIGP